ncbi:DUF2993 domain-containing protein [Schumannella sp. 10F1B-5-1]|uniref:LmeA family phospholipid-binding protein n=1 Tax=Schumannella sp. 10F1B-5-1 TaxID=2590780 RepID=UPI001131D043|nr:DUF2993 domain-containing protein [Schumannella sp. 10F1B-5-1]TPW70666.1 DUF2993 domain-containing protein [Schumannella sp. 10F1B-5-1]
MSDPAATPDTPVATAEAPAPGSPRRRRPRALIVVAAIVVVMIVLVIVAEFAGRAVAAGYVRDRVVSALDLTSSQRVDVDLGGGSILLQALAGRADRVVVEVPDAKIAGVTGPLSLTASGIPIRGGGAAERVAARFVIEKEQEAGFQSYFQRAGFDSVAFDGDRVEIASSLSLLEQSIPVQIDLSLGADGGALVFTPTTVHLGGEAIELAEVADSPFGPALERYIGPKTFCVNEQLPAGIGLRSAVMKDGDITLRFAGDDVALAGGAAKGTCS